MELRPINVDDLKLLFYPHPSLRVKCTSVEDIDIQVSSVVDKMLKIMNKNEAVGLAAPQVGVPWRLFVYNVTPDNNENNTIIINPILDSLETAEFNSEGCLSLPDIKVNVKRAKKCRLQAIDENGRNISTTIEGLEARIIQHEMDHLNGKLMIDYQSPVEEISNRRQIKTLKKKFR